MRDLLYLAWRYLVYHRVKTAVLVCSITMIVYLPVGLNALVSESARELTARAEASAKQREQEERIVVEGLAQHVVGRGDMFARQSLVRTGARELELVR